MRRAGDASKVPEVALPLVETAIGATGVEEQDARCAFD
jgi:hypothetical protein